MNQRIVKIPFGSIIRPSYKAEISPVLASALHRSIMITSKAYLLLRSLFMYRYSRCLPLPVFDKEMILDVIRFVCSSSSHPDKELQSLFSRPFEDGTHLEHILKYYSTTMLSAISNNIRLHFLDHLRYYIHHYFKFHYKELYEHDEKKFYSLTRSLYHDLMGHTSKSDPLFHPWLESHRHLVLPPDLDVKNELDIHPEKFILCMIYMFIENEKIGVKVMQVFPIQNGFLPKTIRIDTPSMIDLFVPSDEHARIDHDVWDRFFDLDSCYIKDYIFDSCMLTDGYFASLLFTRQCDPLYVPP